MNSIWRIIDSGYLKCSQNIALDRAMLLACSEKLAPETLRFFQYPSNAVLLGHYQEVEQEVRLDFCQRNSIEVNRRLTGGPAIYWDRSMLGWEVLLYREGYNTAQQLEKMTRKVGSAIVRGLNTLGLAAKYKFPAVIEIHDRQIGWFSGTRQGNGFFYQGYIHVNDSDVTTTLHALRIPTEKLKDKEVNLFKEKLTSLTSTLKQAPAFDMIASAIEQGFCHVFNVSVGIGKLQSIEKSYYKAAYKEVSKHEWVFGKRKDTERKLGHTVKKKALLSVSVSLGSNLRSIKKISLSGDFSAYPLNIVRELESELSKVKASPEVIRQAVSECFKKHQASIIGLTPGDISHTLLKALEKLQFLDWGATIGEINEMTMVAGTGKFSGITQDVTPLLIPYCAKAVACKFRNREGCGRCGRCDVGTAYKLADEFGLEPITIQNYEMLEEKLKSLKNKGCKVFIGTCCESFWLKHGKDFERIGLPGILINVDNNTCYELGKEQAAYTGRFDNQTKLKLNLIRRTINVFSSNKTDQHTKVTI